MTPRGRFVTIEGGEGTGKTTLIAGLRQHLPEGTRFTREPGGSDGAEEIRALLVSGDAGRWDAVTEVLLLNAARRDHVTRVVEPALLAGDDVICDRYLDSTRVYQGLRGVSRGVIDELHSQCVCLDPSRTLILDAPAETGLARAQARGGDARFESMGLDYHNALREAFLDIAASEPERCRVIDATQPPEAVLAEALDALGVPA